MRFIQGHQGRRPLADRFWEKVDQSSGPDACWLWTGGRNSQGYGAIGKGDTRISAHRCAWELTNGTIGSGLYVCHNCPGGDNPTCVNPAHLYLGTHQVNLIDAGHKGQMAWGERSPKAKLSAAQVREIRARYSRRGKAGNSGAALAQAYGISRDALYDIVAGRSWAHLK